MRIDEMFGKPGFSTEKDDNSVPTITDLRKSKLTLSQINRLRQMRDVRNFEREKKRESVSKQYKAAATGPM